tara:strand:- start:1168 stop:1428 length:261 start_codon:yes stop_codon:yes gene_type:complete
MRAKNLNVILHNMECKSEEWTIDNFHAKHRSGLKIWIGNGFLGYHIEKPKYQELGLIEKYKLHKKLQNLIKSKSFFYFFDSKFKKN